MKKLRQYLGFDLQGFLEKKTLTALSVTPWKDGRDDNAKIIGTKIETVITRDDTDYGAEGITNLYEKIMVKIPKVNFTVPSGSQIELVNGVGSVYGEYSQHLSVKADDVKVIGGKQ